VSERPDAIIPARAETLGVLRLIGRGELLLMLEGDADGYGTRWTLGGQQVQPAIARYLMDGGYLAEIARSELGVRRLTLSAAGKELRDNGLRWWASLSLREKLQVIVLG